jgi:hypothetical protein
MIDGHRQLRFVGQPGGLGGNFNSNPHWTTFDLRPRRLPRFRIGILRGCTLMATYKGETTKHEENW